MQTTIMIRGTHCNACKMLIEDACKGVRGVTSCSVDYISGKTVVNHDGPLDINTLKKEIEKAGAFTVQESHGNIYQCAACGLQYIDKEIAAKCEKWCVENKSCNLEIIAHAIDTVTF